MILLVKFAKERNVNPDTVTTYVRRHPELFEGHIQQQGNKLLLDDVALKILDEKYPLPKPIEVIEDTESRQKLIAALERLEKAKDFIQDLKDQYSNLQIEKIELETSKLLIEEKKESLENALESMKELKEIQEQRADELQLKNKELEEQLKAERARKLTWHERFFGQKEV